MLITNEGTNLVKFYKTLAADYSVNSVSFFIVTDLLIAFLGVYDKAYYLYNARLCLVSFGLSCTL